MKNKLGVYYGFLANSDDVNWIDCLNRAKAAGLDILEMSASKLLALPKSERETIARHARDLGLGITCATGLPPEGDVSSDDPAVRARGVKLIGEHLHVVKEMGGFALGGILTGVSKDFPIGVETTRNRRVDHAILALREAAKIAEDCDVTLGIEAVNRFESPLVNTAAEALRVAEAVASPRLGILLDSFHMNIEETNMGEAIRTAGKYLAHFHACENNRMLPGRAHVDWNEVFDALGAIGYKGALVMEALPGPYGSVAPRLNIWRQLSEDVDGELKEATRFLREQEEKHRA